MEFFNQHNFYIWSEKILFLIRISDFQYKFDIFVIYIRCGLIVNTLLDAYEFPDR